MEFKQFIERVKLRAPIEEVVQARVPDLKRAGALWQACCPFHEEKTPSFKVNPTKGTWYCYGACGTGGDAISFVERFDGLAFIEALEVLAQVAGEPMPEFSKRKPGEDRHLERLREALADAEGYYARVLRSDAGAAARAYLERRGMARETIEAFGLGFAPAVGSPLCERAKAEGTPFRVLADAGLARTNDSGRPYDFFRGRLVIPIRDWRGRTVGFGARRLDDDVEGPKYVNTPRTALFDKKSLVYGLDRAIEAVRRVKELVLVEGYTDVMAAHQVGVGQVAAVLGTATTSDHAARIRQTQARRVVCVFDGDEAGRAAAMKALHGLLPLGIELRVATLPAGCDPCDVLLSAEGEGPDAFRGMVDGAAEWFEFLTDGLRGLDGGRLADAVDPVLGLLDRLANPVHRDARLADLARFLELPEAGLRQRMEALRPRGESPSERRPSEPAPRRVESGPEPAGGSPTRGSDAGSPEAGSPEAGSPEAGSPDAGTPAAVEEPVARLDPREILAYRELAGACLVDNSMIPALRPWFEQCADRDLRAVLDAIGRLYDGDGSDDEFATIDCGSVLSALGEDPARGCVVGIEEHARRAESPRALADGATQCLEKRRTARAVRQHMDQLQRNDDPDSEARALREILDELRRSRVPKAVS